MDISDSQALGFMRQATYELHHACAQSRLALIEAHAVLRIAVRLAGAGYGAPDGNANDSAI